MTATSPTAALSAEQLAERLLAATIGTLEIASIDLGVRLGFYRSLAQRGPSTAGELAAATGTFERYVREWLEQQAVAGFLRIEDPDTEDVGRTYGLPDEHRRVFVEEEDLNYLSPLASLAVGTVKATGAIVGAYRRGGGVPYEAYEVHAEIGSLNRPQFVHLLGDWLASVPAVDSRLRGQPPARIADLACGTGWSSIAIARAYPGVTVDARDSDASSIRLAQANIEAAGLSDRVTASVADVGASDLAGPYDLITVFEALHDMNHPVEALRAARAALATTGSVLVADERVAEVFTAPGDEVERFNYGWSVLHCLLVGTVEPGAPGTGTVIRPDTVRAYAAAAGFGSVEVLAIEHDFWRFYLLNP